MQYKVNKNVKFSTDGINVISFTKGQIITDPDEILVKLLGRSCKKLTGKESSKSDKTDDVIMTDPMDDLDLDDL